FGFECNRLENRGCGGGGGRDGGHACLGRRPEKSKTRGGGAPLPRCDPGGGAALRYCQNHVGGGKAAGGRRPAARNFTILTRCPNRRDLRPHDATVPPELRRFHSPCLP